MQAYGDAAMRNYGDLDLLVRDADVGRATQLMMDAGYVPQIPLSAIAAKKIPGQYMFRQTEAQLLVEVHNDRTMRYYPRSLPIEKIFARGEQLTMDGRGIPAPNAADHLMMICVHGAKHFWERLMWIADVAALVERNQGLDWRGSRESAQDAGTETMLHAGLLLAAGVLKARVPAEILRQAEEDAAARAMVGQVRGWLPAAGENPPGLWERARYRTRMRGGGWAGTKYLLRLLFSPTEEDWDANSAEPGGLTALAKRPFRLAKKHGGGGKE